MKNRRIGRNDRCWCGSGLKFKKCHLGREEKPGVPIQEVLDRSQEALSSEYCLHPEPLGCSGKIVRAHSVQRNGGLTKIAKSGRVFSFLGNNVMDIEREKGLFAPKLVGVRMASTFTGFCDFHDNFVFSPIEKYSFASTQEHAFLLGYRHFCKELFIKTAAGKVMQTFRKLDRGRPLVFQRGLQSFADNAELGLGRGLKDVEAIKATYDKALLQKDFSEVRYYIVRFNEIPDLLCCAGHFPEYDFDGTRLQDLLDFSKVPDHVTFSLIVTDNGGAAVFSWLGSNPTSEQLVNSLQKKGDDTLVQALVRMCFSHYENLYFAPAWWDGLDARVKSAIRQRFTCAMSADEKRQPDYLHDDGTTTVHWTIAARETNLTF